MEQEKNLMGGAIVALISLGMYLCFIYREIKILEETKNRLIFQVQPTLSWAIGIFFGSLTLLSLIVTIISPPITILECTYFPSENSAKQHYPSCQLLKIDWLGTQQSKTLIAELKEAIIDTNLDANSNLLNSYRVTLVTERGNILLSDIYTYSVESEYQHLLNIVSQINSFVVKPSQNSLLVEKDEKVLGYTSFAISVFFGLITFLVLALSSYITCSFEEDLNLLTLERRNLFRKKVFDYKISEVIDVKVEESSDMESTNYRLTLILESDRKVPLTYSFNSGWKEKEQIARRLKKFVRIVRA
jgi:hypothetical protein